MIEMDGTTPEDVARDFRADSLSIHSHRDHPLTLRDLAAAGEAYLADHPDATADFSSMGSTSTRPAPDLATVIEGTYIHKRWS